MSIPTNTRGFTLIETLFYMVGLLILLAAMTSFLYYMYDWYQRSTVVPRMDRIGVNVVDTLVKDIRSGTTVNGAQSSFGITQGALSFAATVGAGTVTKYFSLNSGRLVYQENGGAIAYISPTDVSISRFYVMATSTPLSEAVKFDVDITYSLRTGSTTRTYSGFTVLRQSYE
jgi:Tfp pilus assembly protein PilV